MIWILSLLCHLVGDYVLQSHVMATRKTSSWKWAAIHATFYTIPFVGLALLAGMSPGWVAALAVIAGTHAAIDRLGIAARWCRFYGVGHPGLWWTRADVAAYRAEKAKAGPVASDDTFPAPPPFIGAWLTIIVDNTMHLLINTTAIAYAIGASLGV